MPMMPMLAVEAAGPVDYTVLGVAGAAIVALWRRTVVLEDRNREDYRAMVAALHDLTAAVSAWHAAHEAANVA